jgi:hypothetical protein
VLRRPVHIIDSLVAADLLQRILVVVPSTSDLVLLAIIVKRRCS